MKRIVLLLITLVAPLLFVGVGGGFPSPLGGAGGGFLYAATPSNVDDMLEKYEQARGREKRDLAQQLMDRFLADDVFFTPPPPLRDNLPADSLDALIFYGAECYYFCNNDKSLSIDYAQRALPLLKYSYSTLFAHVQSDMARVYYFQSDIQRTIEQGNVAAATCKHVGDNRELARVYSTLSYVYQSMRQGPEAVNYALKAYDTYRQTGDTLITHSFLTTISESYAVNNDYQNCVKYGKLALQSSRRRGSSPAIIASDLDALGYAYYTADSLAAAKRVLNESLQLLSSENNHQTSTIAHQYLGFVYLKEHNNALAAEHFRQGLYHAKQNGALRDICNLQRNLYEALRSTSPAEALQALEQYTTLRDTLFNDELQTKLSQATATFHNEQLRAENEAARRANRNIMISTTIVVLFFLLAIAALLYAVRTRSRSIKAMRELQQSRETFFTNVTHEFRTPLTVILGMADKLKAALAASSAADAERDTAATDLTLIEHNANRLLTLVNQLLDIAKISTSTGNPEWQQGNVVAFVSMIVESFRQPAEQQGVDLTFTATPQAVDTTFASEHLQKILTNLLSNALKFTPAGGSISVGFQQKDKQLVLTVSDTGRGILPADLPHVFDPFFQGTNNTFTGTGVGLALVKQLVESLHGTISVESTPDVGTTFRVEIKEPTTLKPNQKPTPYPSPREGSLITLANDDAASTNTNAEANQSPLPWGGEGGGCSILVVEDNRDVAYYIGSVLGNDYEVAYAYDGAEGIAKAEELMPDLIITDVMMPDVDGLEMCHHIRSSQLTNHIPIIIITARATDDDRLTGIEAGADVYLYKPFRADELQLRVSKLLEQRRLLQEKYGGLTPYPPLQKERGDAGDEGTLAREESAAAEATALPAIDQASREFIERLRTVVFELMPRGEVDTDEVASRLFMSRSQLGRKTKAIVNKSPATYILEIRLQEAKRLIISQPQLTLLDVALRCGFADNSHLTHAFRRVYKITPTQLRTESS